MKRTLLSIGQTRFVLACFVAMSVPAGAQNSDSLQIRNVSPPPQTPLNLLPGQRTRLP